MSSKHQSQMETKKMKDNEKKLKLIAKKKEEFLTCGNFY